MFSRYVKLKMTSTCLGKTKKGLPCNSRVKDGKYCRHHKNQEKKEEKEEPEECPVCYDAVADKTFECGHSMCMTCYKTWCSKILVPTCHMCRAEIDREPPIDLQDEMNNILTDIQIFINNYNIRSTEIMNIINRLIES